MTRLLTETIRNLCSPYPIVARRLGCRLMVLYTFKTRASPVLGLVSAILCGSVDHIAQGVERQLAGRLQLKAMTHDEAIKSCSQYLHLVDKPFLNGNDEKESIKAVVAWDEGDGNWQPHVCFYNWARTSQGDMSHMRAEEFLRTFQFLEKR